MLIKAEDPDKSLQSAGLIRLLIIFTALLILLRPVKKEAVIDMLSVGQGDCIVLNDGKGHTVICDGGSSDVESVGKYRLIPYLKFNGIKKVDAIYLSHPHEDHYNALAMLLELSSQERISIGAVYVSCLYDRNNEGYAVIKKYADMAGVPIRVTDAGSEQVFGGIFMKVIFPVTGSGSEDENDDSLVILGKMKGMSLLLTGDITSKKDDELLRRINGLFQIVSFSFVSSQLNGGEKLTCVCTVNGTPYPDVNNAGKINAGLDIINAICKAKGVNAPIFVDNAESVNNVLETSSQKILLCVTKDKKLLIA